MPSAPLICDRCAPQINTVPTDVTLLRSPRKPRTIDSYIPHLCLKSKSPDSFLQIFFIRPDSGPVSTDPARENRYSPDGYVVAGPDAGVPRLRGLCARMERIPSQRRHAQATLGRATREFRPSSRPFTPCQNRLRSARFVAAIAGICSRASNGTYAARMRKR